MTMTNSVVRGPRAPMSLGLGTVLIGALVLPGTVIADEALQRLELSCTEEPVKHVVFGDAGEVSYEELPPREQAPVPVTVIRIGEGPAGPMDTARFESPKAYLSIDNAVWTTGRQVDADAGRLRLDLRTNVLTVAETQTPGQASFRRFQCRELTAQ